jgi:uncharacterized Zn finger protein
MADFLFSVTEKNTLSQKIKTLTKSDYNALADSRVLERGESYFNHGAVYPNITIELGSIEAEVDGSEDYEVDLEQIGMDVFGACSCPYNFGGICKHLVAVLLHLQHNVGIQDLVKADITELVIQQQKQKQKDFEKYVKSLDKATLQKLVLELATEEFRREALEV